MQLMQWCHRDGKGVEVWWEGCASFTLGGCKKNKSGISERGEPKYMLSTKTSLAHSHLHHIPPFFMEFGGSSKREYGPLGPPTLDPFLGYVVWMYGSKGVWWGWGLGVGVGRRGRGRVVGG